MITKSVGGGQISRQSNFPVVILSGTQWSEESLIFSKASSFAEFTLERSEGLKMTKECNSLLIMGLQDARKISHTLPAHVQPLALMSRMCI